MGKDYGLALWEYFAVICPCFLKSAVTNYNQITYMVKTTAATKNLAKMINDAGLEQMPQELLVSLRYAVKNEMKRRRRVARAELVAKQKEK